MTEIESNPWCFVHFDTIEEMFEAIEKSRSTNDEYVYLTPIGKSWKTHPENFLKFPFSGSSHRPLYWKTHPLKIMSSYSVFFQFWMVTQTVLLENSSTRIVLTETIYDM